MVHFSCLKGADDREDEHLKADAVVIGRMKDPNLVEAVGEEVDKKDEVAQALGVSELNAPVKPEPVEDDADDKKFKEGLEKAKAVLAANTDDQYWESESEGISEDEECTQRPS